MAWTVRVEWYRLDAGHVGEDTGESREWHHRGRGVAAFRRLRALISGAQRRDTWKAGADGFAMGVRLLAVGPDGQRYSAGALRAKLYAQEPEGAPCS